jgi:hypothetical protein
MKTNLVNTGSHNPRIRYRVDLLSNQEKREIYQDRIKELYNNSQISNNPDENFKHFQQITKQAATEVLGTNLTSPSRKTPLTAKAYKIMIKSREKYRQLINMAENSKNK